ncbi:MAG: M15 family metallopeptidase [Oscillospiraceae bacterium]|nr:M15 family metallopeptidase [Oscillospiraceae bacterium]MBQ9250931.1 M15 family metallopeptidase [Oscillospiraceae bacterium]
MQLKEKNTTWMIVLAVFALLLGVGIQIGLGLERDMRTTAQGRAIAAELTAEVRQATEDREQALYLDTAALAALPAEKAAAYEDLHLELLLLVNPWNPVPEDYSVEVIPVGEWQVGEDQSIATLCADALLRMIADCQEAGYRPYICSSYRTQAMQEGLFYNKLVRVLEMGYSWDDAPDIAAQSVAPPGTSEHQLGLAADIIDSEYTYLDEGQERTGTQRWLMENSWRYGFILRYPNGTTDITGIIYEPWHYRYVGQRFAKDIYEKDVTLEEYIALRRGR